MSGWGDPNPVSVRVDGILADEPVVTSRHTNPADAVPLSS